MTKMGNNFFSISFDLIVVNHVIPYDLYVNSSANEMREKYVRIYPKDEYVEPRGYKIF